MNIQRVTLFIICLISIINNANSRTIEDVNTHQSAGKYFNYPYLLEACPAQTPTPVGYKPFHIEHYGRHGSRWHIGYKFYDQSYDILKKAHDANVLTPLGEQTYQTIGQIREIARQGRSGELSDKGAAQHRIIAGRMVDNFPEIFVPGANLNARSTTVIRAILSMQNGLDAIRSKCPHMKFTVDASNADMWYLKYEDKEVDELRKAANNTFLKDFKSKHSNNGQFLDKLINDARYAADSVSDKLFAPLFYALVNCQSHSNQPWLIDSIFTLSEVREQWLHGNAEWLIQGGNTKLTQNRTPFTQANLLYNIINSADSALISQTPSINLRYGHDSVILPLVVLMEFDDFGVEINNLEDLEKIGWHDYLIVPMAANIQIIFYRKPDQISKENDILVKILLNEREVKLPIGNYSGPYYNWTALKDYYLKKIEPYINSKNTIK